jgi:murein DD-endopeptidase MepM/ murein hydrolase activator NlpD
MLMKQNIMRRWTPFIVICLLILFDSSAVIAQKKQRKKTSTDVIRLNVEPIPVVEDPFYYELDQIDIDSKLRESLLEFENFLKKERSLLAEDSTNTWVDNIPKYVSITEELKIDCVWVSSYEYFSVWDSYKLNPYDVDVTKLTDTLILALFDTLSGRNWAMPIKVNRITSDFGFRRLRWHFGQDLSLNVGDSVLAAFDGIVRVRQFERNGYGNYLVVRHANGLESLYGHLSKFLVKVGDEVKAGDLIGLGGNTGRSTGPHLHFELRYLGNAIDPKSIFDFEKGDLLVKDLQIHAGLFDYIKEARKIVWHRVKSGETLSHISKRYGVSIAKLTSLNGISKNSTLRIGQNLRVN